MIKQIKYDRKRPSYTMMLLYHAAHFVVDRRLTLPSLHSVSDWFADEKCFVRNVSFPACQYLVSKNITDFIPDVDCHTKTELASEQYFK